MVLKNYSHIVTKNYKITLDILLKNYAIFLLTFTY